MGNRGDNILTGNDADNILYGGDGYGIDTLNGGLGADTFMVGGSDGGTDIVNMGTDSDVDTVDHRGQRLEVVVNQFTRGVSGDRLSFTNTGIDLVIDVKTIGNSTVFIRRDNYGGSVRNVEYVLLTLNGVTGFTQANIGENLAASNRATFRFS
jgi:hypothetical protein